MKASQKFLVGSAVAVLFVGSTPAGAGGAPPTTVITHGYQITGTFPAWSYALADAIARRSGLETGEDGQVWVYQSSDGTLSPCQEALCTTSGTGHTVIPFDWAVDSNQAGAGFSEAAAEALFAGLVAWSQQDPPLVDLARLHLIGHSRGTVVNSEVAERLIAAGFPAPIQVTSLDPHDSGAAFAAQSTPEGGLDDYDVNLEHPEYDCHANSMTPGVCAWQGTGHNDNYWQDDPSCFFLDPEGLELFGAANFNQNDLEASFCHSDTHIWYYFTADTDAVTHPVAGTPPGMDWFGTGSQCTGSPRIDPLLRTADGYNLSDATAGSANRCPSGPGDKEIVLFGFDLQEGLVNGDFERVRATGSQAGWSYHGGLLQASLGVDGDSHLILNGGDSALHNRFFLPVAASAIQICTRTTVASNSDLLSLVLSRQGSPDRELLSADQQSVETPTNWACVEAPVLAAEVGETIQLQVSLTNLQNPTVLIDDLRIVLGVFADGFESGNTDGWSITVP